MGRALSPLPSRQVPRWATGRRPWRAKSLRALGSVAIACLASGCAQVQFVYTLAAGEPWALDGPVFAIPGGSLKGEVRELPSDWAFTDEHPIIEIEVRPDDPYSVNLFCVSTGATLYVASGTGGEATFAEALMKDPRIRLRIDGLIYEHRAVRVMDVDEMATYTAALVKKYPFMESDVSDSRRDGHEGEPAAWLFRVTGKRMREPPMPPR